MSVPPQEAAEALRDIERAQRQSAAAYRDQKFSPHLFLWGVIWIVGYTVTYVRPRASLIWIALLPIGIIASFWIGGRGESRRSGARGWLYGATAVAIFLFITALFAILPPKSGEQPAAVIPILVALFYALIGIWTHGTRIALLGLALGALTVAGYFWLPQYFLLWMAWVGGGALILGGFWLRRL
jgi:hypothetical protein